MHEITVVMLHSVQPLLFQVAPSGISKPQICRVKSDQGIKRKQYKANGSCKQAHFGHLWQNSAEVNVHAMTLLGPSLAVAIVRVWDSNTMQQVKHVL